MKRKIYQKYIKRPQDIILALFAIILFSPVFVITYILVRNNLGRPVIYTQKRTGINSTIFTIFKFRSMTDEVDEETGEPLSDEIRLTKFGKKLRSTSLDELPQLFNILKGDMSFVGPRPQLVEFLPFYNETQIRRHEVRPGLSGLAQINGRNDTTWSERFSYDVKYVDNVTFLGDWKIILTTIWKVIKREGIDGQDSATMERFNGKN